ncbi:MAG TPA: HAMP domain-containing sensor histidine kinase [Anaerovoracaceae bacterium]|nr:HAMP domain-containing sensor histidine kinase [Anaerovoracaceae bacterium]
MERTRELDQANEELRYMDEMKSNFLSTVSHEIRTPLSAMLGFTEVIGGTIEKNIFPRLDFTDRTIAKAAEKITRDLNIIMSEGGRLSTLIGNLLNISKIESGETDLKREELAASELIGQSLSATKSIVEKAELTVYTEIEIDLPRISGDRDMLTEVIINLISNAVKFTREGYIRISAVNSGDGILFSVEDTGIGIKEEGRNNIFDRFYKSENAAGKEKNTGTGLGLYICRQIIEKHGGAIWVESQYGEGSTFYFTVPHEMEKMEEDALAKKST